MSWSRRQLGLAALMLLTGSINTLAAKWADNFSAGGCGETEEHRFQHPFVQAVGMFLGEFSCLGVFYLLLWRDRRRSEPRLAPSQPFNPLLFLPPALCDMTGTSIMYVALNMTSASSFQMLRGSVIVFTGLLSVAFLGRRLELSQWLGIGATILGLLVVGLADLRSGHGQQHKLSEVITGDRGHPDGAGGEIRLQARRAPAAGRGHRRLFRLRPPGAAAGAHVLHPGGGLQRQPPGGAGGRPRRFLPAGPAPPHRPGPAGHRGQHRLLQLRRPQRHQGAERHHPHGAGQPAHLGRLGLQLGFRVGELPRVAAFRVWGAAGRHGAL
ncbi:solute carrier family 35 member F6 isoform 2-T2 [Mergus octosetaceus]